jgi:hypothetical protein
MARVGAGNASELSLDRALLPMAFTAIALCIAATASAHGGRLNAEGCHHDHKHGGYHCHRGGASLSRNDLTKVSRQRGLHQRVRCMGQACSRIVRKRALRALHR